VHSSLRAQHEGVLSFDLRSLAHEGRSEAYKRSWRGKQWAVDGHKSSVGARKWSSVPHGSSVVADFMTFVSEIGADRRPIRTFVALEPRSRNQERALLVQKRTAFALNRRAVSRLRAPHRRSRACAAQKLFLSSFGDEHHAVRSGRSIAPKIEPMRAWASIRGPVFGPSRRKT
jgi:hypothetical protein